MKKNLLIFGLIASLAIFTSCNDYGTKLEFGSTELYYTDDVKESEAEDIGEYLQDIGFTDGDEKTVQIAKDGDTYQFRMVVEADYLKKEDYEKTALEFIYLLSFEVLDGEPVELHMCDEYLKTQKVVEMDDLDFEMDDYDMEVYNGTEIEYDETVSFREVDALGEFLIESGFTDGTTKNLILTYERGTYTLKMVAGEDYWDDAEYRELVEIFAAQISEEAFDGKPVEVHLCNAHFETQTVIR